MARETEAEEREYEDLGSLKNIFQYCEQSHDDEWEGCTGSNRIQARE